MSHSTNPVHCKTGYEVDNQGVGVWIVAMSRIYSCPCHPASYARGSGASFLKGKAVRARSWPLTSIQFQGQENMDLHLHSPIRLHGIVLYYLSKGQLHLKHYSISAWRKEQAACRISKGAEDHTCTLLLQEILWPQTPPGWLQELSSIEDGYNPARRFQNDFTNISVSL
jgi:hypothetical protein